MNILQFLKPFTSYISSQTHSFINCTCPSKPSQFLSQYSSKTNPAFVKIIPTQKPTLQPIKISPCGLCMQDLQCSMDPILRNIVCVSWNKKSRICECSKFGWLLNTRVYTIHSFHLRAIVLATLTILHRWVTL